jgi:hypothetical protein
MAPLEPLLSRSPVAKKKTKKKKTTKKFKNRGGSVFNLSVNGGRQHDIILDEMQLGGIHKMSGETDPFDVRDLYRAVLFFMRGIPLDHPIDKKTDKEFKKILKRLQKEEPELFLKHSTRIAGLK